MPRDGAAGTRRAGRRGPAGAGGRRPRAGSGPAERPPSGPAGYSGTPLPKKLGIKPGARVLLTGAPPEFESLLEPLPPGAAIARRAGGAPDLTLLFARTRAELDRRLAPAIEAMGAGLWIVWPKKSSGMARDLGEGEVRARGLEAGLVDYKICAVDATWSGLKFARRAVARPGTAARAAARR